MDRIIIIGAGLVGSLLSVFLAKRGHKVDVYERNPDPRETSAGHGRSINLTLCDRGFKALDFVGVGDIVRGCAVPAYGRLMHDVEGKLVFQPYGNTNEAIHSISRSDLNRALLDFAEKDSRITFHFNRKCVGADLATATVEVKDTETGNVTREEGDLLFGSDGAHSTILMQMQRKRRFNYSQQYWEQGYKELRVPAGADAGWTSEKNVLHIWPRSNYMLIGFPNTDGSFTCSLHIPFEGEVSYESVRTEQELLALFRNSFPDVVNLLPSLVEDFFANPPNTMITVKCWPWTFNDKAALIGDSAHSIYPSYGQGANAGFEDCLTLYECIERHGEDWGTVLGEYQRLRKPNTDAIADLCVDHFIELRDLVGDPGFILRKEVERKINQMYPDKYKDLYSMITFTCMPYAEAMRVDREQRAILDQIMSIEDIRHRLNSPEVESRIDQLMQSR
ncbi:MAG TPA: NAD(P)/FAD-dependent oxidoreductase [Blastocatellia bacterium]|nr:NAD(P)/FAD-dependent oxidoreductase [Blastocatellia bacterium]